MVAPYTDWPDLKVEIAPGYTPRTVAPTWVDVTDLVAWELVCERGRFGSGSSAPAGSMRVNFDDPSRILDGANTAGTHAPYIRPRLPVRFRATYSAVDYPIWRGHLTTPGHAYPPDGDDTSSFDCVDLLAVMASVDTSERSAWATALEALAPLGWWRLGEATPIDNNTATDETGRYPGRYAGTSTTTTGLIDDEDSPAINTGTTGQVQLDRNVITAGGAAHSLVFRFRCPAVTAQEQALVSLGFTGSAALGDDVFTIAIAGTLLSPPGTTPGQLYLLTSEDVGGTSYNLATLASVADGLAHTVTATFINDTRRLYVDGVLVDEQLTAAGASPFSKTSIVAGDPAALWIGTTDGFNSNHADNTVIDDVVLLPVELTAAQALDLHDAAVDSWAGETTGARIARAANLAGIPAGLQDIAAGISTVVGWNGGQSTLDVADTANTTEQGILVVAADGKVTFENRHAHLTDSTAATFGDTGSDLTYCGHKTEQGEHLIINRATFTSPAGTAFAEDTASIAVYDIHSTRRTTIDDDQANLVAGAQHLIARYNGPEQRIVGLEIDPMFDPANLWPQVLGRDIGDRILVKRTPSSGSAISQTVTIVGVRHTLSKTEGWRTFWSLSDADTTDFAISDVSTSDGPAVAAA